MMVHTVDCMEQDSEGRVAGMPVEVVVTGNIVVDIEDHRSASKRLHI